MGCYLTVKFAETGYKAVEPMVNWLEASPHQIDHIEANDSKCLFTLRYITLRYATFCSVICYVMVLVDSYYLRVWSTLGRKIIMVNKQCEDFWCVRPPCHIMKHSGVKSCGQPAVFGAGKSHV